MGSAAVSSSTAAFGSGAASAAGSKTACRRGRDRRGGSGDGARRWLRQLQFGRIKLQVMTQSGQLFQQLAGKLTRIVTIVNIVADVQKTQVMLQVMQTLHDSHTVERLERGRGHRPFDTLGVGIQTTQKLAQLFVIRSQPFDLIRCVASDTSLQGRLHQHAAARRHFLPLVTREARQPSGHHDTLMLRYQLGACPLQHGHLLLVVIRMALGTIGDGVGDLVRVEGMVQFEVARHAIDFVVGHVRFVDKQDVFEFASDRLPGCGRRCSVPAARPPLPRIRSAWQLWHSTPCS